MINNSKYLLSIVIPTKNRQYYASMAVKQIISVTAENIQIVIQDNSDTNELLSMLGGDKMEERIKYDYVRKELSFVDNFNHAIENCDGEYICMIGDDDGINPDIAKLVTWAKKNNIQAIKTGLQAVYLWPDAGLDEYSSSGQLDLYPISKKRVFVHPRKNVINFLRYGCLNYLDLNLVKLYHGIVRKECLSVLKRTRGYYIGGLSPDIYSAIALSLNIENLLVIEYPYTISGICKKSGSADSATGRHTGNLSDAPHFKGHDKYEWAPEIPAFYSVETIWADSALAAVKDYAPEYINKYFDIYIFSIYNIIRYNKYKKTILQSVRNFSNNKLLYGSLFGGLCKLLYLFIKKKMLFCFRKKSKITQLGVKDILEAQHILNSKISIDDLYK